MTNTSGESELAFSLALGRLPGRYFQRFCSGLRSALRMGGLHNTRECSLADSSELSLKTEGKFCTQYEILCWML